MEETFYYSIASGSTGNCSLYVTDNTAVLIDLGVSVRKLSSVLQRFSLKIDDLDAVLITHEHNDHIRGLNTFVKQHQVPLYASQITAENIVQRNAAARVLLRPFQSGEAFTIHGVKAETFATPHDTEDSVGYILSSKKHVLGYATDLGFMPHAIQKRLCGCDTVVLESNHDSYMLEVGPYPRYLKQRVSSARGHLSNFDCAQCAVELVRQGVRTLILAHLSEHNNTPMAAFRETKAALNAASLQCELYVSPKFEMDQPIYLQQREACACSPSA